MNVDCAHWLDCGGMDHGRCAAGHFTKPSRGVCLRVCRHRLTVVVAASPVPPPDTDVAKSSSPATHHRKRKGFVPCCGRGPAGEFVQAGPAYEWPGEATRIE